MFGKAKEFIKQGHIYQINYSFQFKYQQKINLLDVFNTIRKTSPVPYGAFLNIYGYKVVSNSPELFFKKIILDITTQPIKGTIKRGRSPIHDKTLKDQLINSTKDFSELIMITDLERNDLNRICKTNTVNVDSLREVKSFNYLFHTLSNISGELKNDYSVKEIMQHLFPGGSITGAPKIRSMEIINHLEPQPRGPYTGSIGYVSANNNMTFNIAIRTLYSHQCDILFHAGGAVVSDSKSIDEYNECLLKASNFLDILEKNTNLIGINK